jgi:hypothetical protein
MTVTRWLRISSIISFLFAAGHTLGARKHWSPMGDNAVLQAMQSVQFDIRGTHRSYLDFYQGFGYSISVFQVLLAVVLWQLATVTAAKAVSVRPIIATITVATALCAGIAYVFILPLPALFSLLLTGTLAVAYFVAPRTDHISTS